MEIGAYIESILILAGFAYLVAGVRLHRLGLRKGGAPERLLSVSLVFWGLCLLLYDLPYALLDESMLTPFSFASRLAFHAGTVAFVLFTRRVFRGRERWAAWLMYGTILCLAVGVGGSIWVGDWEGIYPLSNPWYWPELMGRMAPMVWMGVEGLVQYRKTRARRRIGLCEPLTCNRFLLWGVTGTLWLTLELVSTGQYIDFELTQRWATSWDLVVSLLEVLPVAVIWFVFFPPARYRAWVEKRAAIADAAATPLDAATQQPDSAP
jgi:hypothetical protein